MNRMQAVFCVTTMLAFTAVMPGCHSVSKPPTPTLVGPDTGWTQVATVFTATSANPNNDGITAVTCFDWDDGNSNGGYTMGLPYEHIYAQPGAYVVKCRFQYMQQHLDWFWSDSRHGDWSNPCTVQVVSGTLKHP